MKKLLDDMVLHNEISEDAAEKILDYYFNNQPFDLK